jgi:hypothetical protein
MENGLQKPVRKQVKGDGRKMDLPGNGLRNWNMDINSRQPAGSLIKFHSPLSLTSPKDNPPLTPPTRSLPHPRHTPPHPLSTLTHAPWAPSGQSPYQDAVTSGNRCGTELIQCAAATRDTQQVPISSDSEMSSSYKGAAESMSDANFAMEMELEEAKAAVEECYCRRARRAGLEGALPAGRPMTEGEPDMLSEILGDGAGSRAKRRREVEEMTIKEMEAELRETKVEIRKRRRAGTGLLPMTLALLMCLMVSSPRASPPTTAPTGATSWKLTPCWSRMPAPIWARRGRLRLPCTGKSSR